MPQLESGLNCLECLFRLAQGANEGLSGSLSTEANMDQFVRSQNVERYRRLLERVTDESDRQQIINLLAESARSKKTLAIWSGSFNGGELRQAAELLGRPLNHYDALGITVGVGESSRSSPAAMWRASKGRATVFAITGMSPLTWTFMYGG